MITLIPGSWAPDLEALLRSANASLTVASPYVGASPCQKVIDVLKRRVNPGDFTILVLANLSRDNMLGGSTDPAAIADIVEAFPNTEVRFLPSLHARVYVADNSVAIVTSSNLTTNGLFRNFEYGVRITGIDHVSIIKDQVSQYAQLGSPVSQEQLRQFAEICSELRGLRRRADQGVTRKVRAEFDRRLEDADTEILRARVAGRAPHAIFAEAILYLLRAGSRRTEELHREIQRIHPDLCDDTIDRVIDGQHFGKKWKHAVRTAQQYLKKNGRVRYSGTHWTLVTIGT